MKPDKKQEMQQRTSNIRTSMAVIDYLLANLGSGMMNYNGVPVSDFVLQNAIGLEFTNLSALIGIKQGSYEEYYNKLTWSENSPENIEFQRTMHEAMQNIKQMQEQSAGDK